MNQPASTFRLPHDVRDQVVHALRAGLPPPLTDDSEDRIRRDNAAVDQVMALVPANAVLAVQFVAAASHALDRLRLARGHPPGSPRGLKCTALATAMMRRASAARRLLLRVQAQRSRRDGYTTTLDAAAWIDHAALAQGTEAALLQLTGPT